MSKEEQKCDKPLKPFRNLLKIEEGKIDCPLFGHDVLPTTACQNCQYFEGYRSENSKVVCTYSKIEKTASVYPFVGRSKTLETIMPGGTKDSIMSLMRQVKKPNDITGDEPESPIARDIVHRDLEPDFDQIADYFGFDLDELKREAGLQ